MMDDDTDGESTWEVTPRTPEQFDDVEHAVQDRVVSESNDDGDVLPRETSWVLSPKLYERRSSRSSSRSTCPPSVGETYR